MPARSRSIKLDILEHNLVIAGVISLSYDKHEIRYCSYYNEFACYQYSSKQDFNITFLDMQKSIF